MNSRSLIDTIWAQFTTSILETDIFTTCSMWAPLTSAHICSYKYYSVVIVSSNKDIKSVVNKSFYLIL